MAIVAHGTLIGQGTFDYGPLARSAVGMASGGEVQGQASGGIVEARTGMSKRHDWDVFDIGAEWVVRVTCTRQRRLDPRRDRRQPAAGDHVPRPDHHGHRDRAQRAGRALPVRRASRGADTLSAPKTGKATYTAWITLSGAPAPTDQLYGYWPLRQTEFANA
jgi:hypothetical protein